MTIELAPHQRVAVDDALSLLDRYGGVLLADDVGLGKSYVAAAVSREMQRRGAAIEVIVPAPLFRQWRETLADFEVIARVITHDSLLSDPFTPCADGFRFIVVDEAHAFRNSRTQRYDALARRAIGAPVLLVTATPICNSAEDLRSLVSILVADDALRPEGVASIEESFRIRDRCAIATIVRELVIRRARDVLPDELRFGELHRNVVWHPLFDANGIDALQFPLIADRSHHALLRRLLWRRLESSEAALLESIRRQLRFYDRALDCLASGRVLTKRDYRHAFADEDERDAIQEVLFWEFFAPAQASVEGAEIESEVERLRALQRHVESSPRRKRELLSEICASRGEPMLIFTGAIATARDIFGTLPIRAGLMTSKQVQPDDAIEAFRRGTIDVLVCTDLAAEGLNLQRAGIVVHYDVPWNPVRLDQRNGRAYRIGQRRSAVRAIYFLPERSSSRTSIVETMWTKNRTRRRLLDSTPASVDSREPIASRLALPQRLIRGSPAVALIRALRERGIPPPSLIARRYRAGVERLFDEMSREYLDERRLGDLLTLLEREAGRPRIIAEETPGGSADR
jgi:superfamily II DNA or RNA helicase